MTKQYPELFAKCNQYICAHTPCKPFETYSEFENQILELQDTYDPVLGLTPNEQRLVLGCEPVDWTD